MASFSYLWDNSLLSANVLRASRENKAEFGIKTIGKFEQNPPVGAEYAPLIAAGRTALDLFLLHKDGSTLNLQKAATQRLDALEPVIISTGKVLESKILSEFETDPAIITEFFPQGRTELSTAKRGDVEGILNRLVSRATVHQAQLGAGWVTRLTALRTLWKNNLNLQSGAVSIVSSSRSQIDLAWEIVAWAFYDLAQQLVQDNPKNAGVADIYFNFSVFTRRTNSAKDNSGLILLHVSTYGNEPIVNATVEVKNQAGQVVETGQTDASGDYKSKGLPPGFYDVTVKQETNFVTRTHQFQVFDDNDPLHEIKLTAV